MKTSRLSTEARKLRRELIMSKRADTLRRHVGLYYPNPLAKLAPHSSKRQRARYARQIAAGQIR